jgi:cysteine-rich repeat protein
MGGPSAPPTPLSPCGNGVLDPGEDCDDGNTIAGDGCDSTCHSEMIPGSTVGFGSRDCFQEWLAPPVRALDTYGRPSRSLHCTEGDPTCDHGGAGDDICTFQVALCFNVNDMRELAPKTGKPFCTPTNIERVRLKASSFVPHKGHDDPFDALNQQMLEAAVVGLGAEVRGQCIRGYHRSADNPRKFCTDGAECDSTPGASDGVCDGRVLAFIPPLVDQRCTELVDVEVPLEITAAGARRGLKIVRLQAHPTDEPERNVTMPGDGDLLRLYCEPPS